MKFVSRPENVITLPLSKQVAVGNIFPRIIVGPVWKSAPPVCAPTKKHPNDNVNERAVFFIVF